MQPMRWQEAGRGGGGCCNQTMRLQTNLVARWCNEAGGTSVSAAELDACSRGACSDLSLRSL
eukprot:1876504-Prorocentrum_lima.AAC.1